MRDYNLTINKRNEKVKKRITKKEINKKTGIQKSIGFK